MAEADFALDWFDKSNPCHSPGTGRFCSTTGGSARTRSERARVTFNPATLEKQRLADRHEAQLARALKLDRTRDNDAFDLLGHKAAVEVKTLIDQRNNKITMHPDSLARKLSYARKEKARPHTVVVDTRGGKTQYFHRAGVGSFRLETMTAVSLPELRRLISGKG